MALVAQFMIVASFLSYWNDLPGWVKILLGIGIMVGAFIFAFASAMSGGSIIIAAAAAGLASYGALQTYTTWDSLIYDMGEYNNTGSASDGINAIEDIINIVNPVPDPFGDLLGTSLPGNSSNNGLVDIAAGENGLLHSIKDIRELDEALKEDDE
jgi:hypothetical protein